jgi:hypothetical protein
LSARKTILFSFSSSLPPSPRHHLNKKARFLLPRLLCPLQPRHSKKKEKKLTRYFLSSLLIHEKKQKNCNSSQPVGGGIAAISGLLNIVSRPSGGILSDMLSSRYGHRSRIHWLFATAFLGGEERTREKKERRESESGFFAFFFLSRRALNFLSFKKNKKKLSTPPLLLGVCMLIFGFVPSLPAAIVLMVFYSFLYEQACGATYSLVPFISNRSPGLVSGFVSAGGTAGAAIWNGQVFRSQTQRDYRNMGIIMMVVSMLCFGLEWPAWGGMIRGPHSGATEQDYYRSEYTAEEQAQGLHTRAMNFAHEASVHGGSQHGGSAFGSRKGSRTNLSRAASKGDLAGAVAKAVDDSARGAGNVAKI